MKGILFHNAFSLIERKAWELSPFDESLNGVEDRFWAQSKHLKDEKLYMNLNLLFS